MRDVRDKRTGPFRMQLCVDVGRDADGNLVTSYCMRRASFKSFVHHKNLCSWILLANVSIVTNCHSNEGKIRKKNWTNFIFQLFWGPKRPKILATSHKDFMFNGWRCSHKIGYPAGTAINPDWCGSQSAFSGGSKEDHTTPVLTLCAPGARLCQQGPIRGLQPQPKQKD